MKNRLTYLPFFWLCAFRVPDKAHELTQPKKITPICAQEHLDSSTVPAKQFSSTVEFPKRSNEQVARGSIDDGSIFVQSKNSYQVLCKSDQEYSLRYDYAQKLWLVLLTIAEQRFKMSYKFSHLVCVTIK